MKTKPTLLVLSSSLLLLAAPALLGQDNSSSNLSTNFSTNLSSNISTSLSPVTNAQTRKLGGEQLLLPPGLKEKMKLTEEQKTELKPIENDFANASQEYKAAHQPWIDAANEANRQARTAKDKAQIQAARTQLQSVWAGLQPYRVAAVTEIKPLLTPDQLKVLEDPKNQWREDYIAETDHPSAK